MIIIYHYFLFIKMENYRKMKDYRKILHSQKLYIDQYKQKISDIIPIGCNCVEMYQKTIDKKIHHNFLTNYVYCLYPELDQCKECDDIIKHTKSIELIVYELLDTFAYKTRDHYYFDNGLLRKKIDILRPNGFFSVMENGIFNNFLITRKFSHRNDLNFSNLIDGQYNEIICGKITNIMFNNEYFSGGSIVCLKWDSQETINIIDKFLEYEFNEETFGDFVTELFPESTDDIILCFEILDSYAGCIMYKIKIPIKKYKYNKDIQICVNVSTGFYGI